MTNPIAHYKAIEKYIDWLSQQRNMMALYLPIYDNILIDQGMDVEDTESTASEDTQKRHPI